MIRPNLAQDAPPTEITVGGVAYSINTDFRVWIDVLRNMRDAGKAIVIITHKMHEVEELSDRVAILRHGHFIGDMPTAKTNAQEMTNMMVGHAVTLNIDRPDPVDPQPRIEVQGLTVRSIDGILKLQDVSFTAMSGEILGIAGISGSGQKELLESIAGLQHLQSGEILYNNPKNNMTENLVDKTPMQIRNLGVRLSFVPEDRLGMGLVGSMDLSDNMMLRSFRKYGYADLNGVHSFWQMLAMAQQFGLTAARLMEMGILLDCRIVPGGDHSEGSWEKQVPFFMNTLLYGVD